MVSMIYRYHPQHTLGGRSTAPQVVCSSVSERKSASNTSPCHFSASFRLLKTISGDRRRGGHRTVGWRRSWPFIAAWWWAGAIAHFLSMRDRFLKLPLTLPPLSRGRLAAHRLGS